MNEEERALLLAQSLLSSDARAEDTPHILARQVHRYAEKIAGLVLENQRLYQEVGDLTRAWASLNHLHTITENRVTELMEENDKMKRLIKEALELLGVRTPP